MSKRRYLVHASASKFVISNNAQLIIKYTGCPILSYLHGTPVSDKRNNSTVAKLPPFFLSPFKKDISAKLSCVVFKRSR